jgi:hypothetical protein
MAGAPRTAPPASRGQVDQRLGHPEIGDRVGVGDEDHRQGDQAEVLGHEQARQDQGGGQDGDLAEEVGGALPDHAGARGPAQ